MTQHNLTQILKVIRDLVMRNRPCYRDYLGTETVTTQIGAGAFAAQGDNAAALMPIADTSFTGFVVGETYTVTLDGVTADYIARKIPYIGEEVGPVIGTTTAYDVENGTFDGWLVRYYINDSDSMLIAMSMDASLVGKSISVSQSKTVKRYNTRLLPEYLLPAFLRKNVVASKGEVQSVAAKATNAADMAVSASAAATVAQTTANNAQTRSIQAESKAEAAQTTASAANSTAADALAATADVKSGRFYKSNNGFDASQNAVILYAGNSAIVSGKNISGIRLNAFGTAVDIRSNLLMYVQEPKSETAVTLHFSGSGAYASKTLKGVELADISSILLKSSTANSDKQFRLTVDDTGTLKATEVTS